MSDPVKKMSDDELLSRLRELGDGLQELDAEAGADLDGLYADSDKSLAYLESADLDSELAPSEEALAGDVKAELERTDATIVREQGILERMEAESAAEQERDEEESASADAEG
ncbi:MAG TPA: hypothetical protein VD862_00475 [Candidatus Paceibacterota bacterium]|nr:hypothetical protein [Candidatus Paceibacterota bacterium]